MMGQRGMTGGGYTPNYYGIMKVVWNKIKYERRCKLMEEQLKQFWRMIGAMIVVYVIMIAAMILFATGCSGTKTTVKKDVQVERCTRC